MTDVPLWRTIQRSNFTSLEKLCIFLGLTQEQISQLSENKNFPLNLPLRLASKIEKGTLNDPIFKQFVPTQEERAHSISFCKDPVSDCKAAHSPKYLKKYANRVLLIPTGACAMHCRYCFRQNFPYAPFQTGLTQELRWIQQDSSIKEVILSGGDPLSLSPNHLKNLLEQLCTISHLERIRFHTRFPIGIPERIDAELLSCLEASTKQIWFTIHCNHPNELDPDILNALKKIQKLGIPVLNQSVLLKGVNDTIETLQSLCETLTANGIFPYYLHQLDRVEGAAHFEVSTDHGRYLISELTKRLSGYGVPKYVQEIASEPSKTQVK
jgi:EF-P beta-lysylation protein EpmB